MPRREAVSRLSALVENCPSTLRQAQGEGIHHRGRRDHGVRRRGGLGGSCFGPGGGVMLLSSIGSRTPSLCLSAGGGEIDGRVSPGGLTGVGI